MKYGTKKRILSLVLCVSMILPMVTQLIPVYSVESEESIAPITNPFTPETIITLPDGTTTKSQSYRIPSMVTLADGTIVAAADIRWNTTYDGGGLDTLVARSTDGGANWSYTVANYLGDNGNVYNGSHSTAFLDPSLLVAADGKTVYMLVDLYPYGVALNGDKDSNNAYVHTQPSTDVGFNDAGYLKLSDNNYTSYDYYLKDGKIYTSNHEEVSGYTVDPYFNITGEDGTDSNLFFENSPFKVVRTGYLYLTSSTDGGETWSSPTLLNNIKTTSEQVCLIAPGRGITTSSGTMIYPVYSFHGDNEPNGNSQRLSFIYSKDGINWSRTSEFNYNWASEAAVIELSNWTLRFFFRNGTSKLCYVDYDMSTESWGSPVQTSIYTNSNTQISAITYSQTVDGNQVVLVSCPAGSGSTGSNQSGASYRNNGRIFVGVIAEDGTINWENTIEVNNESFMYSCLTERNDGSIAILYEDKENAWGTGDNCYYEMSAKSYSADDLGVVFDKETDSSTTDMPSHIVSANGVSIFCDSASFTGVMVSRVAAPTASFIKNSVAYDVVPTTNNGVYTGSAKVTIAIPSGWNSDKVFGYVKESNGSITVLAGEVTSAGTYAFTTPHFSEVGLFEATAIADVTDVTVVLEIGETSDPFTVSDSENVGTAGTYNINDGSVEYSVVHTSEEGGTVLGAKKESLANGDQIVISDGNGNYLKRNGTNIASTNDISEATVWTVGTSGTSYTLSDDGYYLRPRSGNNTYSLNVSNSSNKTSYRNWSYSSQSGFYYSSGVQNSTRYLRFNNNNWSVDQNVTSNYGAAYTKVTTEAKKNTDVTFTGLDVTSGTAVTIGNTTYNVVVNAKESNKSEFLVVNDSTTLDAIADLGLSGNYTVTYTETADDDNVITVSGATVTAGTSTGEATVTATVTSASGKVVGTVTYTVTVSNVVISDVESIYIPVGGTALIEGLFGDIYTGMLDENIATYTVANNGNITFTGVADGKTVLVVGNTQINVFVNPKNTGSGANTQKHIYISVKEIENCDVYFAINGGTLHKIEDVGVLINQTYYDGFNIMFFAVPSEGYALTKMSVTNSDDQYYSLAGGTLPDGSDTAAWPFQSSSATTIPSLGSDSAWKDGHGFRWALIEGNMSISDMRDLFTRALALGADGATTFTKNGSDGMSTEVSFIAEKLPTFEKSILYVNGKAYNEGDTLEFADIVTYQFKVTTYSTNVTYTNIKLTDSAIGYSNTSISGETFKKAGINAYTATYTISANDLSKYANGTFVNTAQLQYTYGSDFSTGTSTASASASVSCKINGIVYYVWADNVPVGIQTDTTTYPIPGQSVVTYGDSFSIETYSGNPIYIDMVNGITVGTWEFKGWQYNGTIYAGGEALTMPNNDSIEFVGIWEFTPAPTYSVTYQWTNAPAGALLPTDDSAYYAGQTYAVDGKYYQDYQVDDGTAIWTFSGWVYEDIVVSGTQEMGNTNVTLVGTWISNQKFTSLTIVKAFPSGANYSMDVNQSFLFDVVEVDENGNLVQNGVDLTVTIHQDGSVQIDGLMVGHRYRITEKTAWSWRYSKCTPSSALAGSQVSDNSITVNLSADTAANKVTFTNERSNEKWLDGDSWCNNIFNLERSMT